MAIVRINTSDIAVDRTAQPRPARRLRHRHQGRHVLHRPRRSPRRGARQVRRREDDPVRPRRRRARRPQPERQYPESYLVSASDARQTCTSRWPRLADDQAAAVTAYARITAASPRRRDPHPALADSKTKEHHRPGRETMNRTRIAALAITALALAGCGSTAATHPASTPSAGNVAACKAAMVRDYHYALAHPDAPAATRPAACKGVPDATLNRLAARSWPGTRPRPRHDPRRSQERSHRPTIRPREHPSPGRRGARREQFEPIRPPAAYAIRRLAVGDHLLGRVDQRFEVLDVQQAQLPRVLSRTLSRRSRGSGAGRTCASRGRRWRRVRRPAPPPRPPSRRRPSTSASPSGQNQRCRRGGPGAARRGRRAARSGTRART